MKIKTKLEKVNEALSKIRDVGSVFVEGSSGNFSAKGVKGRFSYSQEDEILTIVIDDKPWLASDSMIEDEIKKFFR